MSNVLTIAIDPATRHALERLATARSEPGVIFDAEDEARLAIQVHLKRNEKALAELVAAELAAAEADQREQEINVLQHIAGGGDLLEGYRESDRENAKKRLAELGAEQ